MMNLIEKRPVEEIIRILLELSLCHATSDDSTFPYLTSCPFYSISPLVLGSTCFDYSANSFVLCFNYKLYSNQILLLTVYKICINEKNNTCLQNSYLIVCKVNNVMKNDT